MEIGIPDSSFPMAAKLFIKAEVKSVDISFPAVFGTVCIIEG